MKDDDFFKVLGVIGILAIFVMMISGFLLDPVSIDGLTRGVII